MCYAARICRSADTYLHPPVAPSFDEIMARRDPWYRQAADYVVDGTDEDGALRSGGCNPARFRAHCLRGASLRRLAHPVPRRRRSGPQGGDHGGNHEVVRRAEPGGESVRAEGVWQPGNAGRCSFATEVRPRQPGERGSVCRLTMTPLLPRFAAGGGQRSFRIALGDADPHAGPPGLTEVSTSCSGDSSESQQATSNMPPPQQRQARRGPSRAHPTSGVAAALRGAELHASVERREGRWREQLTRHLRAVRHLLCTRCAGPWRHCSSSRAAAVVRESRPCVV